ncbi:Hok/Gef family protein [Vibrio lentus]
MVVCATFLAFTWIVYPTLCVVDIKQGNIEFLAHLAYEVK